MATHLRIRSPFPAGLKSIVLNAKGVTPIVVAGDLFHRVPIENPHALTVNAGHVDVYAGTPSTPHSEIDVNGVYQEVITPGQSTGVVETTPNGNQLIQIAKVEWVRNVGT